MPGLAEVWAREVEKRVDAQDAVLTSMGQDVRGQNRNTASSLESLGEQVVDLAGRRVDSSMNQQFLMNWSLTTGNVLITTPVNLGVGVNFTIVQPRAVRIRASMEASSSLRNWTGDSSLFGNVPEPGVRINDIDPMEGVPFDPIGTVQSYQGDRLHLSTTLFDVPVNSSKTNSTDMILHMKPGSYRVVAVATGVSYGSFDSPFFQVGVGISSPVLTVEVMQTIQV